MLIFYHVYLLATLLLNDVHVRTIMSIVAAI